jgi:hypothetical protein
MRLLRNFRSHEWDNNPTLKPLLDLEVEEFIISLVDKLMNNINIVWVIGVYPQLSQLV